MLRPSVSVRPFATLLFASFLTLHSFASSQPTKKAIETDLVASPSARLLPETFAGWQLTGTPQTSTDPLAADVGEATVLQEFGFVRYQSASYTRDSDSLNVKAIEFGDATGAFGAFTFYRRPNMHPEQIGQGAAFDGARVLLWSGTNLIDARFSRLTPMSAAELRDLVTQLPKPFGNQGILPTLPAYLPPQHLDAMSVQYAIGPHTYQKEGGVLPVGLVDFSRSAEVVTAQYNTLNGTGTLTIVNYPTPEIAIDREHAIQAFFTSHGGTAGQNSWTPALASSNPPAIQTRRSGPLVAVTSGDFSAGAAQELLQRVHYEVNLTISNRGRYTSDPALLAQIILSVAFLVGIFAAIAIVAAVSLGGGRVLWRKMRGKSGFPEEESGEFIRLNLKS